MKNPYKIAGPTAISFSGGRTSAYMLWRVLQANSGLPKEAKVCFANTGKEEEATLRFVNECSKQWNVPITWVEYRADERGYAVVNFETASRDGEPFEAIVKKRNYLPNPVTRFCTVELKIRAMHRHLRELGWADGDGEWDQMVGIRADEPARVARIRARPSPGTVRETMVMPLADDGVTVHHVQEFWDAQPWGLELPTYKGRTLAGNCDLCFMKPAGQIASLIAQRPERAVWWAKIEALSLSSKPSGAVFRSDRPSYAAMLKNVQEQKDMFAFEDETGMNCFCGD